MLTEAIPVLLLLQAPPETVLVNVIDDPAQTVEGPAIVPALGAGFTVINVVVNADAHAVVTV